MCVCVCVQSKVSNNVSGRMCLAIEIYLHYYSVLTMRLGSSIPPLFPSSAPHYLPVSSNLLRSSLSLLRSLGCPSTRQALSTATRPSLHPEAAFVALASVSVFFTLRSSLPSALLCSLLLVFGLQSLAGIAFKLQLPRFDSSSLSICKMSIYSSASIQV